MRVYQHIFHPEIPALDPDRIEEMKRGRSKLNLVGLIETMNLDSCLPPMDKFLNGIPDLSQLARIRRMPPREMETHLNIEACFWTIAKIRFDKPGGSGARKTTGYISTNPTILKALKSTTEKLIEMEYRRRVALNMPARQIYELFQYSPERFDGLHLGQLLRIFGGLTELSERNSRSSWIGTIHYEKAVERKIWKTAPEKWRAKNEVEEERASANKPRSIIRTAPSLKRLKWETSVDFLGPFLACRLLLRGEHFSELEQWIDQNTAHPDLPRIYCDAALARSWLLDRGFSELQIRDLDRILDKLNKKMTVAQLQASTEGGRLSASV